MAPKLTRSNVARHLRRGADVSEYWRACLAEQPGAPAFLLAALGDIARVQGMSALAKRTGLSRVGLYKALSPAGNPEFATVLKVIQALGLTLTGEVANRRPEPRPTVRRSGRRQSEAARMADEAERERIRRMSPKDRALLALDLGERLGGFGRRAG